MNSRQTLDLIIALRPAALDARRGIVRVHREVLAALGLQSGDPIAMHGRRTTTGIAIAADNTTGQRSLYADDLTIGNLGLRDGDSVTIAPVTLTAAKHITVAGPPEISVAVSNETLRLALLSKVVSTGDDVSLLPLDIGGAERESVAAARRSLSNTVGLGWTTVVLTITEAEPTEAVMITSDTQVSWRNDRAQDLVNARPDLKLVPNLPTPVTTPNPTTATATPQVTENPATIIDNNNAIPIDDLAGLHTQQLELTELLDLGFNHQEILASVGTTMTLGILITGPVGSGKTTLAASVAAAQNCHTQHIYAPDIAALTANDAANALSTTMKNLKQPAMLLIEKVEALAPTETTPLSTVFKRLLREALSNGHAIVCTTASPENINPELRSPGLIEHEITVPMPDRTARRQILNTFTQNQKLADDVDLDRIADHSPGFVAADLVTLVREASIRAAMRAKDGGNAILENHDFNTALETVRPSSMAESTLELATLTLDDVGDMTEVKQTLTEAVLWPLTYPDAFSRLGIEAPRGVLLYGPPGCGKTFLVKALAGSGKTNVLSVKGAELLTKWVGDSEASVRDLFRRARQAAPTLIFFDEIDALAPVRGQSTNSGTSDRVVASLLTELDGIEALRNVVVIGATNRPDMIDPALLRPGRLERLVYVPPPNAAARAAILSSSSANVPLSSDVDLEELGAELENFSAADCAALIREAALTAMRESVEATEVTSAHIRMARETVRPSLNPVQLAALEAYANSRQ